MGAEKLQKQKCKEFCGTPCKSPNVLYYCFTNVQPRCMMPTLEFFHWVSFRYRTIFCWPSQDTNYKGMANQRHLVFLNLSFKCTVIYSYWKCDISISRDTFTKTHINSRYHIQIWSTQLKSLCSTERGSRQDELS